MMEHKARMDAIYMEHEKRGDFDNLPGKGKPLPKESLEGDVLHNVLKHANYLPPWLELQRNIRDLIGKAIGLMDQAASEDYVQQKIDDINSEIRKYNGMCPISLQKGLVTFNNLRQKYDSWE
nr:DUF1992 domain-containing protein [Brevibacillus laterosporus]